jgi:ribosome-associated translation inhibitor RaiA
MAYSDESYDLHIELATKGCELSAGEIAKMEDGLSTLKQVVRDFPVSKLHITVVHHARSNDHHVKTSLQLPRRTFFTGERDRLVHPAYERCLHKLIKKVEAYKHRMHADDELAKQAIGTRHTLLPTQEIDAEQLDAAVRDNDYVAFRKAAAVYEESLSDRVGRWIERYPEIASHLGESVTIADLVEEVYLNAFEQFTRRPQGVLPGQWFESLIDPSVQALLQSPDEEFENISFARSLMET